MYSSVLNETYIPLKNRSWKEHTRPNNTESVVEKKAELTKTIDAERIHFIIQDTDCSSHTMHITIFVEVASIIPCHKKST